MTLTRIHVAGLAAVMSAALLSSVLLAADPEAERFWPQWRGPYANGVSRTADPPLEWSETKNIRWKIEIPGRGSSSPVVWGDRLFVTTAIPMGATGAACARAQRPDPTTGRPPVQDPGDRPAHGASGLGADRHARSSPRAPSTKDGTWASSSAITDGRRVFAFFDSSGLYAYDMDGTLLWEKHFGDKKIFAEVGESGSTPVLYGDHLVVVWDHQGASFIVALNASTGQELWRTERQDVDSWGTPLVVEHDGRAQVVTTGDKQVRSYDLETGRLVWENDGLDMNPIPSPVAEDGLVFVTAGFRSSRLHAIRLADAQGNIAGSRAIVWSLDRDTPYVSVAALVRRRPVFPQEQRGNPVRLRRQERPAALSGFSASPGCRRSTPHPSERKAGCTSPAATGRRSSSATGRASRCWRPIRSTMGSTPRRRWWTTSSTCAAIAICTASRPADRGLSPAQG